MQIRKHLPIEVKNEVNKIITDLEKKYEIKILLCVEAGSRSWGLPSVDSDYDIRFIYHSRPEKYLALSEPVQEVVEKTGLYDVYGIDVKKALQKICENNQAIYEWFSSDIIYKIDYDYIWMLQKTAAYYFDAGTMARKYYGLAINAYRNDIKWRDMVKVKKYVYCLRSILCCRYVLENESPVPLDADELTHYMHYKYKDELDDLIRTKSEMLENYTTTKDYELEKHVTEEIEHLVQMMRNKWPVKKSTGFADSMFCQFIKSKLSESESVGWKDGTLAEET